MKIILNIVIACLIIFSSNALNLSSSRRRASTEAAAYMRLTNLLGYTNGYKALMGFGSTVRTVYYCDLIIEGKSVIEKETHKSSQISSTNGSTTNTSTSTKSSFQRHETSINLKSSFELTVTTIQNISRIESNNSINLIKNLNIDPELKEMLFTAVDDKFKLSLDPLRLVSASNNWQPQNIQMNVQTKKGTTVKIDLVVLNFKTFSQSRNNNANEMSIKDMTDSINEAKKKKIEALKSNVNRITKILFNLQQAITLKVLFLKKQEEITIYEGRIQVLQKDMSQCLELRAKLEKEYFSYEMEFVEMQRSSNKYSEEIKTCKAKIVNFEVEMSSVENKIAKNVEEEKNKLLAENNKAYTHIFYWLEASFFYRVYKEKLVANENEVKDKFSEAKIKANAQKLSEVFYPLETDLTFMS